MDFAGLRGRRWTSREPGDAGRQRSACTRSRTTSRCSEQWCDRSISEAAQWQQRSEASSGAHTRSTRSSAAQRDASSAAQDDFTRSTATKSTTHDDDERGAAQRSTARRDAVRPDAGYGATRRGGARHKTKTTRSTATTSATQRDARRAKRDATRTARRGTARRGPRRTPTGLRFLFRADTTNIHVYVCINICIGRYNVDDGT